MMHRRARAAGFLLALGLGFLAGAARAEETSAASEPPVADAVLQRMARFLASAKRFTVRVDSSYDVVQQDGQKLEFGEIRRLALRRPDRMRVDVERLDGARRGFLYDGANLAVFDLDRRVYTSVPKAGGMDAALAYFTDELGMRLPLAELFSADLPATLQEAVREASYVETARIDGVPCDHVAARGDQTDLQVWVAQGPEPAPRRVVITYRQELGQPQFRAQLSDWNFAPELPDKLFAFSPQEGAERISIQAPPAPTGSEP